MEETGLGKVMPQSQEAEQSVIGAMIMDQEAIAQAMEILTPDDFYQRRYGLMFEAMTALYSERSPVDPVTLRDRLARMEAPAEVSSPEFLRDLINAVPTSANIRHYAFIVQEKARLRRLIRTMEEVAQECYQGKEAADQIMEDTEKKVFQVLQQRNSGSFEPIKDIVLGALDRIEAASRSKGSVTGLATGFIDLDYKTSGLQNSDLVLVAARPSMGKTAFVLNMAEYIAFRSEKAVAVFSLEMSRQQLVNRLLAMEARVDAQAIRNGNLSDEEWTRLIESAGTIGSSKLIIDDTPGISVAELRSRCRKYKLEHQISVVMIDYLQLMTGRGRVESRQQEISDISRSLKELARELQVPVVALSQLSRAVEQRPDHRPMLSDLRESGAIEQDADVVMFLYREDYYKKDAPVKDVAEVIIAKQRNGPIGTVQLAWVPQFTKFMNFQPTTPQNAAAGAE